MKYYAMIDGDRIGPVEAEELIALPGFSRNTDVWCEGMPQWLPAGSVTDLAWLFETPVDGADTPPPFDGPEPPAQEPPVAHGPRIRPAGINASPYGWTPYGAQAGYVQPAPDPSQRPYNWLGWSIFITIVGLLTTWIGGVLGVIGIVYSIQATNRYERCDYIGARSAAQTAKVVNIIGLVLIALGILFIISLFGLVLLPVYMLH